MATDYDFTQFLYSKSSMIVEEGDKKKVHAITQPDISGYNNKLDILKKGIFLDISIF